MFLSLLGLLGGCLFGAACVPMAWRAWRTGTSGDTPVSAMWLFFGACLTYFGYLFLAFGFQLPFVIGIVETACWIIVLRYRYFPRFDFADLCTREDHHHPPCNGLPRANCLILEDPLDDEYTHLEDTWGLCRCSKTSGTSLCPVHRSGEP